MTVIVRGSNKLNKENNFIMNDKNKIYLDKSCHVVTDPENMTKILYPPDKMDSNGNILEEGEFYVNNSIPVTIYNNNKILYINSKMAIEAKDMISFPNYITQTSYVSSHIHDDILYVNSYHEKSNATSYNILYKYNDSSNTYTELLYMLPPERTDYRDPYFCELNGRILIIQVRPIWNDRGETADIYEYIPNNNTLSLIYSDFIISDINFCYEYNNCLYILGNSESRKYFKYEYNGTTLTESTPGTQERNIYSKFNGINLFGDRYAVNIGTSTLFKFDSAVNTYKTYKSYNNNSDIPIPININNELYFFKLVYDNNQQVALKDVPIFTVKTPFSNSVNINTKVNTDILFYLPNNSSKSSYSVNKNYVYILGSKYVIDYMYIGIDNKSIIIYFYKSIYVKTGWEINGETITEDGLKQYTLDTNLNIKV